MNDIDLIFTIAFGLCPTSKMTLLPPHHYASF